MLFGPEELRLLWAMLLCALPLAACYRLARGFGSPAEAAGDALLLAYLLQYVSVGLLGLLGLLTPLALSLVAGVLTLVVYLFSRRGQPAEQPQISLAERWAAGASFLFVLGFVAAAVYFQALKPPVATDELTYHLPAAVQWLQHRRIDLFQTWFFNPANTYSPLAGSMFAAWLMAPLHNDVLARFMQIGPLFLIFFSVLELCRQCDALPWPSAIAAVAVVLSRPFISEALLAKDDLFLAAFFLAAVAGLSPSRLRQRWGPWRVGVAIGLMLATKYTALLSLPVLLLGLDAPLRARWRAGRWMSFLVPVVLLSGPWFARNWILTGNPLFPTTVNFLGIHFAGLFIPARSTALTTLDGTWNVLTGGYYSLPPILAALLAAAWLAALIRSARSLAHDPVRRLIILGPPLGLALFICFSPYAEVRFVLPILGLLFAACAFSLPGKFAAVVTAIIAVAAVATSFAAISNPLIVQFTVSGVLFAAAGLALRWFETRRLPSLRKRPVLISACIGWLAIYGWLSWHDFLDEYRAATYQVWQSPMTYGELGQAWAFVGDNVPSTATIAYANEFMIYPLYGFDHSRKVIYAPIRPNLSIDKLVLPRRLSGEQIAGAVAAATNEPADRRAWIANLRGAGAEFLFVGRAGRPPEIGFAGADPREFQKIFENPAVIVYRIALSDRW